MCPCVHVDMRTCGHVSVCTCEHVDVCPCGHADMSSPGRARVDLSRPRVAPGRPRVAPGRPGSAKLSVFSWGRFQNRPRDHHKQTLHVRELRMHQTSSRKNEIEAVIWLRSLHSPWEYQKKKQAPGAGSMARPGPGGGARSRRHGPPPSLPCGAPRGSRPATATGAFIASRRNGSPSS